jgi:predicted RNA-binding Zn ribbon-like protein
VTLERDRRLRFDTGATWLDLVATVSGAYGPEPFERLYDLDRLREWLTAEQLLPEAEPVAADLDEFRRLREALRGLALARHRAEALPAGELALLNDILARDVPLSVRINRSGALTVSRPATAGEVLARVARQAVEHLTGPEARTLGACADHDCGMLFLDPAGRRRWCAPEICGVRNRVRAHRERQRSQ